MMQRYYQETYIYLYCMTVFPLQKKVSVSTKIQYKIDLKYFQCQKLSESSCNLNGSLHLLIHCLITLMKNTDLNNRLINGKLF